MTDTIKENREFRRAYHRGKCYAAPALVTYVFHRRTGGARIGITTGKKVGNAVARSRARRVIRAAWRALEPEVCRSADIVFVARAHTPLMKSTDLQRVMRAQLTVGGMLTPQGNGHEASAH